MTKCQQCQQKMVDPLGPNDAWVGYLAWEPVSGRLLSVDAERVLSTELYLAGYNSLLLRQVTLWPHPPNTDQIEPHLKRALGSLAKCKLVLLFGTDITQVILGTGISGIVGLWKTSPLLPKAKLLPAPHPGDVPPRTLGEFRLCISRLVRNLQ